MKNIKVDYFKKEIVGKGVCPVCGNKAFVSNPKGHGGDPGLNYFEDHEKYFGEGNCAVGDRPFKDLQ